MGTLAQSVLIDHKLICRSIPDGKITKIGVIKKMNKI